MVESHAGELPKRFGRYRILKRLGEGGMGAVYLAHDSQLDRPVALKVPHFRPEDGPAVLERFYREARAAATLQHPNICPVHDVGDTGGVPYLTMAYIEGRPLAAFVRDGQPLSQPQAAAVVRKLALALEDAHRHGVIHRDLKPANVMINTRKEPIIMDFGLARQVNKGEGRLTQVGMIVGTPSYMPPEQFSGDLDAVGPAGDVYSLGVMLYELLTGRLPFQGALVTLAVQVTTESPPPPSTVRPDLDARLDALCLRMLAKKPEERPSMADLARELGDFLRGSAPSSTAILNAGPGQARRGPSTVLLPPPRSRAPWIALAIGVSAAFVVLLGVLLYVAMKRGTVNENAGRGHDPRDTGFTNSIGMNLVEIPAGKFLIGAGDGERGAQPVEYPRHWVEITTPFHMGTGEVTQEQYEKVMGVNPSWFCAAGEGKDRVAGLDTHGFPVEMVSWEDAAAFCRRLSRLPSERAASRAYRLPTEAEWEYACRAGAGTPFSFGNSLSSRQANIDGRFPYGGGARGPFLERTTAVGSYPANGWGLCDMHGNVWEWCLDWYGPEYYKNSPPADPRGPDQGEYRIVRGGGWFDIHPAERRDDWRCALRGFHPPGTRRNDIGFRVACVPADREPGLLDEPPTGAPPPEDGGPKAEKPVNLLALVDLQSTFVRGAWEFRRGALVSPPGRDNLVQIPYIPPAEYRLVMVVERNGTRGAINLGLIVGEHRVKVVLDGFREARSGLGMIDGRDAHENETTRAGIFLKNGLPSTVVCTVRRDGIVVRSDGREVINWKGDPARLSVSPPQQPPNPQALFVATYSAFTISQLELTPLSGAGRRLEPAAGEVRCLPVGVGVGGLALAPNGRQLLVGSRDFVLRLADVSNGRLLRTLEGNHGDTWNAVAFTRDGRSCLSGGADESIRLWDAASGRERYQFVGHSGTVTDLALAPDGRRFVTAGMDGTLRLWQLPMSGDDLHGLKGEFFDGTDLKNKVGERIDDVINWQYFQSSPDPDRVGPNAYSIRWTGWLKPPAQGRYHFTVHADDGVRVWLDDRPVLNVWNYGLHTLHFETDLSAEPHALRIEYFQANQGAALVLHWSLLRGFPEQPVPRGCLFHDEAAARKAVVTLGDDLHRYAGHNGPVWGVAFSPNNRDFLSAGEDGTVRLWDSGSGKELRYLKGHMGPVWCVAFSPDGRRALTGGSDRTLRLWDVPACQELRRFLGHRAGVRSVAFSPDGRRAVSGSHDQTVRVWDLETESEPDKERHCFRGHTDQVHAVGFFPDGRRVFSGAWDGTIRVWSLADRPGAPGLNPKTRAALPGPPVDLLKEIELPNTFVRGPWTLHAGVLASPPGPDGFLRIPYAPPPEYRIELVARRIGRRDPLGLGIVAGGNQAIAFVDGHGGTVNGLSELDGRPYEGNDSTRPGRVLADDQPATVVYTVRRDGVTVTCDGRPVLDWKGDPRRLSMHNPWRVPDSQALFLATWSTFAITKMELTPLTGEGHRIDETAGELRRFPSGGNGVTFFPDGRRLVTGTGHVLRLFDVDAATGAGLFEGPRDDVWTAVPSPDGRRLLSGGKDAPVRLWDADTGLLVGLFPGHAGGTHGVAFSPDGRRAASCGNDGTVKVWELPPDLAADDPHGLRGEYFQGTDLMKPVGERIDRSFDWLHEFRSPHPRLGHDNYSIRWTGWLKASRPGKYTLVVGSDDGVRLWLDNRLLINEWHLNRPVAYRADVALTDQPHRLRIEYFQAGGPAHFLFNWSPGGGAVSQPVPVEALFHDEAAARQAVVKPLAPLRVFRADPAEVLAVAFSPDGKYLLSGGKDRLVRLWEVEAGVEVRRFEGHTAGVRSVAFSLDGLRALSAGPDGTVRLWDVGSGAERTCLRGHRSGVTRAVFCPDGRRIVSGGEDGTVRLWDAEAGRLLHDFRGHAGAVLGVAASTDGRRAASASADGTVRVWRLPR